MVENTNPWESAITGYLGHARSPEAESNAARPGDSTRAEGSPRDGDLADNVPRDLEPALLRDTAAKDEPAATLDAAPNVSSTRRARPANTSASSHSPDQHASGRSFRRDQDERLSNRRGDTVLRRHWARAKGLFVADSTPETLTRAAMSVQRTVPTGRRIAVVGSHGGAGATTVAAALGTLIASLRTDHVTLLGTHPDRGSLSRRIGGTPHGDVPAAPISEVLSIIGMGGEADLLEPAPGQPRLSLATYPAHGTPPSFAFVQWLCRTRAVVIADSGEQPDAAVLRDAHTVVLCLAPTADSLHAAAEVLSELHRSGVEPRRIVPVVVETTRDTGLSADTAGKRLGSTEEALVMPFDRHLATGARIHAGNLAEDTRVALTVLAGRVIDIALDGAAHAPMGGSA